jgi:hypothetical protein
MEPSGILVAFETFLQVGKLYLMILDATVLASPVGAAPMGGKDPAMADEQKALKPTSNLRVNFDIQISY